MESVSLASVAEHRQNPEWQPWQEVLQQSLQSSAGEHPVQWVATRPRRQVACSVLASRSTRASVRSMVVAAFVRAGVPGGGGVSTVTSSEGPRLPGGVRSERGRARPDFRTGGSERRTRSPAVISMDSASSPRTAPVGPELAEETPRCLRQRALMHNGRRGGARREQHVCPPGVAAGFGAPAASPVGWACGASRRRASIHRPAQELN